MFPNWNYWVLVVLLLVFAILWFKQRSEFFEDSYPAYNVTVGYSNEGPAVYQRHPVQVSVMEDMKFKYKKAYNYELENKEYKTALEKTFKVPKQLCIQPNDWSVVEPVNRTLSPDVEEVYKYAIEYVRNTVKESSYFQLPDNLSLQLNQIQVVHDRLISYQKHKVIPSYIMTVQLVLYREAKYHAKDIGMTIRVDKEKGRWGVSVLEVWINGVIFEDQVGLFPVTASDPLNTNVNLSSAEFKDQNPRNYIKKGYEYCASNNLDETKAIQCVNAIDLGSLPQVMV